MIDDKPLQEIYENSWAEVKNEQIKVYIGPDGNTALFCFFMMMIGIGNTIIAIVEIAKKIELNSFIWAFIGLTIIGISVIFFLVKTTIQINLSKKTIYKFYTFYKYRTKFFSKNWEYQNTNFTFKRIQDGDDYEMHLMNNDYKLFTIKPFEVSFDLCKYLNKIECGLHFEIEEKRNWWEFN